MFYVMFPIQLKGEREYTTVEEDGVDTIRLFVCLFFCLFSLSSSVAWRRLDVGQIYLR